MGAIRNDWQTDISSVGYKNPSSEKETAQKLSRTAASAQKNEKADTGEHFATKSSKPKDSVGQLASELAKAETRVSILQVSSKATRALIELKMSYASSEGKEKKKISQMIKRMEKLVKRINKKLEHLNKEELLEIKKKQAEKKQETKKAEELQNELKSRRGKRRRDEQKYANQELAEDSKEGNAANGIAMPSLPEMVTDPVAVMESAVFDVTV